MTEQPNTAAGRGAMRESADESIEGRSWLLERILAIESEARQQDGLALRAALVELDSAFKVFLHFADKAPPVAPAWLDFIRDRHETVKVALATLPPSAPPALDALATALCEEYHRGSVMTWTTDKCGTRDQHLRSAERIYARLYVPER